MKIVLFTTYYPPFLESYYSKAGDLSTLDFSSSLNQILNEHFADTGATYHYAIEAGHECFLVIANDKHLQTKWARENSVAYTENNWQHEIALAQVKAFAPDILYIESVFEFYGAFLEECSQHCKRIVSWISTPFDSKLDLRNISLVVSSTQAFVDQFRSTGMKAEYMLPAFDVRVLQRLPENMDRDIAFSFIGGWSHVHHHRKMAIKELVKKTPIQIWGYGYEKSYSRGSLSYYRNLIWPYDRDVLNHYNGEAWGLDMYTLLGHSLITFNIHEALLKGLVGNMRMFEATGMGALLLNEDAPNLPSIFTPGKEIETYSSMEEAVEKVNYYLDHHDKAMEIGRNAQLRTIADYNYTKFVSQLTFYFEKALKD